MLSMSVFAPLTPYPCPSKRDMEIPMEELQSRIPASTRPHLNKLALATFPIFKDGNFTSHGVAISDTLFLTIGPYQLGEKMLIGYSSAIVIFDGSEDDFPFQILQLSNFETNPFSEWLLLESSNPESPSVQINFKDDPHRANNLIQVGSLGGVYPAANGVPCMSLNSGKLHAIHQGLNASQGHPVLFNVGDIYNYLSHVANQDSQGKRQQTAQKILKQLNHSSPIRCSLVVEEVINKIAFPILFNYDEIIEEDGSRQIKIWRQDRVNEKKHYRIFPNLPHFPHYDLKELYYMLAKSLATNYLEEKQYPPALSTEAYDTTFHLTELQEAPALPLEDELEEDSLNSQLEDDSFFKSRDGTKLFNS